MMLGAPCLVFIYCEAACKTNVEALKIKGKINSRDKNSKLLRLSGGIQFEKCFNSH